MKNKLSDRIIWGMHYFLPAAGALYFMIANVWKLPYGEQIVCTVIAVDTFLHVLLSYGKFSCQ